MNFIFLIAATLMFSSCVRGPSEPTSDSGESVASYKALEMTGESINKKQNSIWKIPTKKTYQYKVCLISRNTNAMVPGGQEFYIEKPDKTRILRKTTNLGCLIWTEDLSYDYTSDSVYVESKRNIIGKGTHKGSTSLHFAINPWLKDRGESGVEFIDLNHSDNSVVENALISELASGGRVGMFSRSSGKSLLIQKDPSILIRSLKDIKDGKRLEIIFEANPFIKTLNLNQENKPILLRSGEYEVYVQLIANYLSPTGDKAVNLIAPELPMKIETPKDDGTLRYQQTIDLKHKVSEGRLELAIKIVPKNAPFDVAPFEGLYEIGEFRKIYKEGSIKQVRGIYSDNSLSFSYSKFLKEEVSNYDDLAQSEWVKKLPPVKYDHLTPRFVRVKGQGETATERTIIYRVSTRVTDSITGAAIIDQKFKIKRQDGEEIEIESNHNGLLHWTNTIHHHYYQPEQFYLRDVKITHVNSSKQEVYQVALNPWDSGWTFGMDSRDRENGFSDAELGKSEKLLAPLLMVDAFRYQTIRFRYVIDEFLTLNVKKAVVMALDPLVQKQTINRGRQFEPLRDGIYLAKIALVKYYIDPFQQGLHLLKDEKGRHEIHKVNEGKISDFKDARKGEYTSIIKKLIRVQAGRITTPLEFSMRDLRMMSIRSNIMVQLETIDEKLLLQDNIINSRINELEKQYNEYNCVGKTKKEDCLTETEKEEFLARLEKEKEEGVDRYKQIMENHLADLKRSRESQGDLMEQRDKIVKGLEDGLVRENEIQTVYGDRSIFDLPQGEARSLLKSARESISDLSQNMQNYWGDWDSSWYDKSKESVPNNHQLTTIQKSRYSHMQYAGKDASSAKKEERRSLEKVSYEAYLANMQTFLTNLHPDLSINQRDIEALERNNYRENPAVPIIDLNLYRNGDVSGLKSRTFIGPCTLVENDNMSEMRPTDTIDEGECWGIDCHDRSEDAKETIETVDNSEFEKSAYHDSLIPFTDARVDDFIDDHRRNEVSYKRSMDILSQMGNFVSTYNVDYISLTDQPLVQYKGNCTFDGKDECFEETNDNRVLADNFVKNFQAGDFEELLNHYFFIKPLSRLEDFNEHLIEVRTSGGNDDDDQRSSGFLGDLYRAHMASNGMDIFKMPRPLVYQSADRANGTTYGNARRETMEKKFQNKVPKLKKADVKKWLNDGLKGMDLAGGVRLCDTLSRKVFHALKDGQYLKKGTFWNSYKENHTYNYLLEKCFENTNYLPKDDHVYFTGVTFDRRYRIIRTGSYEHLSGKNMNINVGVDFSVMGYSDVNSVSTTGIDSMALLGATTAGVGALVTLVAPPVGAAMVGVGLAGMGGVLIQTGSYNEIDGAMDMLSTSVNAATFLVVQKAEMEITVEEHEKCLTSQFSNELIKSFDLNDLGIKEGINLNNKKFAKVLGRGFIVCEGVATKTPEKVIENYYYVTQHFTAGDMLDDVNLLNHAWLLALRGTRDFNTFIKLLKARKVGPEGEKIEEEDLYDYSLSRLGSIYNQVIPTFPGMYSKKD